MPIFLGSVPVNMISLKSRKQIGRHGSHEFTIVVRDDTSEGRDRAGNLGLAKETKNSQHGQSTIVDFLHQATSLPFIGILGRNAKRIVQVQGTSRNDLGIKLWELSNLTTFHVVLL